MPKKEASPFSREVGSKVSQSALKIAVEKALLFMTNDELPPHWDRDLLFGMDVSDDDSDREGSDSDVSTVLLNFHLAMLLGMFEHIAFQHDVAVINPLRFLRHYNSLYFAPIPTHWPNQAYT